jgi:hypothetical protein
LNAENGGENEAKCAKSANKIGAGNGNHKEWKWMSQLEKIKKGIQCQKVIRISVQCFPRWGKRIIG